MEIREWAPIDHLPAIDEDLVLIRQSIIEREFQRTDGGADKAVG